MIKTLLAASLVIACFTVSSLPAHAREPGSRQVQVPVNPKLIRSADVKTCPPGKKPCGDSCLSESAACNLPSPAALPGVITLKPGENPPVWIDPESVRSTDVKNCPEHRKPCGDSCISATASCNLNK